ncbi:MAG TPA: hypothetical protein VMT83_14210 [Burkholderiaceae bacterium]|nr:hypothetical protein [Burkholderiaceae bacterium]
MNSALADQLEAAVTVLASHGALKDRLGTAWCQHLEDIDAQDLPLEAQQDFTELWKAMHAARALPGDSIVRASVRKLSNEDAQRYCALIVRLYGLEMLNQNQLEAAATTLRATARSGAAARGPAPMAALLTLEGGASGGARPKHANGG